MSGEVPPKMHTAIRLMYVGFVVTALDVVLSLLVVGRYTHDANVAKDAAASYTALPMGKHGDAPRFSDFKQHPFEGTNTASTPAGG